MGVAITCVDRINIELRVKEFTCVFVNSFIVYFGETKMYVAFNKVLFY